MGGSGGEDSMEKDGMMSFEVHHHAEDVGEIAVEYVDGNKSFDKPFPFIVIAHGLTINSSYEKPVKRLDFICPISSKWYILACSQPLKIKAFIKRYLKD